jgi:hypothetical protein
MDHRPLPALILGSHASGLQADEHQKDGIDKLVLRIVGALVMHLAAEQSAETQRIEKLDHRNQPRLAGQVPRSGFVADFPDAWRAVLGFLAVVLLTERVTPQVDTFSF